MRKGKWILHFPHEYRTLKGQPGRDGKPGEYEQAKTPMALFDLKSDLGQTQNIGRRFPHIVNLLKDLGKKARRDLGDSAMNMTSANIREPGRL